MVVYYFYTRIIEKFSLYTYNEKVNLWTQSTKQVLQQVEAVVSRNHKKKEFNEEKVYELLNKVSIECMKSEKDLYSDFEDFSSKLEKEIEKAHN